MTPTHIPPAMAFQVPQKQRGDGVPEWLIEVPVKEGDPSPGFMSGKPGRRWIFDDTNTLVHPTDVLNGIRFARAATPTEITAARDGQPGVAENQ